MMESTEKLTGTNAILAYLYESFPLCFIAKGPAKPLKIGLFQDLSERLADDEKVSKTQLRHALRRYTNSWRYLKCVKDGVQRVDLDGNECGELEQEHIDHAKMMLKQSQQQAKVKRMAKASTDAQTKETQTTTITKNKDTDKKPVQKAVRKSPQAGGMKPKPTKATGIPPKLVPALLEQLNSTQRVNVKLGKSLIKAVVVDVKKTEVLVQLDSGLSMKVRIEHIFV